MKKSLLAAALIAISSSAYAHENQCTVDADYDINIEDKKIVVTLEDDKTIEFEKNRLLINGENVELTPEQRQASNDLQEGTRALLPKVAHIAVEGAELGLKAATIAIDGLFGEDNQAKIDLLEPIEKLAERIKDNVKGHKFISSEMDLETVLDKELEKTIEVAFSKYGMKMAGNILAKIFSGDEEELKDLEFRMETLERDIETYVEANAEKLEKEAEALCEEIKALDEFDKQLESLDGYPKGGLIQIAK